MYISFDSTDPGMLYGGTWERLKKVFLFAADDDQYTVGSSGGEETHTLTVDEMPNHNHPHGEYITDGDYGFVPAGSHIGSLAHFATKDDSRGGVITDRLQTQAETSLVGYRGGSQPHNNMPPYLAVYMWRRVA